ncbi:hypothetical protein GGX14DRAFT_375791, partial [Mycena pura]
RASRHANEQLLFHGTSRGCLLGDEGKRARLCNLAECFLCCILRNSFDIAKCGECLSPVLFGTGIYTTACSSKADDYITGVPGSSFRAVLVNRVVVGNPFTRQYNAEELNEPPTGYHSVVGEPGEALNYGETVVYTNDAIRPAFLIVYATDVRPEVQIADLRSILSTLFKTPVIA